MDKIVWTAALAAAVVAAGYGCKRVNGAYCDDARPCVAGQSCDLVARECRASTANGGDMAGTGGGAGGGGGSCGHCGGTTPLCAGDTCIACTATSDGDAACAAASSSTPHCASDGSCIGCRDASDCGGTTPFCDATTHQCRGCIADAECPSLVCELTPGVPHVCVDTAKVEYADVNAATNGNGLLPTTPRQKLQDAINHATGSDARPYVHVAAGTYNENVGVTNATTYLVGADGAVIKPTNNDALGTGAGGVLTVRNLVATAPNGNGANCTGGSLTVYRSQFLGSKQNGIYASNCALTVDGAWIDSNVGSGVYIMAGNFTIINSIITRNTNSGGVYQLNVGTATAFVNNTVADNSASGTVAGVTCAAASTLQVRNSLLFGNKGSAGTTIAETNCTTASSASDDPTGGPTSTVDLTAQMPGIKGGTPVTATSYHLSSTSPCVNKASALYQTNHDFDFEPRPDPTSMLPDIGADEVQ